MERLPVVRFMERLGFDSTPRGAGQGQGLAHRPLVPLVDVRSPAEYAQGHVPGAVNLPLLLDAERAEVGSVYKRDGREKAVFLGFDIVGARMGTLARELAKLAGPGRGVALYCSRGGMRSAAVAWLCDMAGVRAVTLDKGYKSFRRYVLQCFERSFNLRVLGGRTGSGKTEILRLMAAQGAQVVDLEGLARHRGSVFGAYDDARQPSSEHFENLLAVTLEQCRAELPVWVEDESENLGTVNIPRVFFQQMRAAPVTVVSVPETQRLARVLSEYGGQSPERMAESLDRIQKRLGGLEHKKAMACLAAGDLPGLAGILFAYYDRAYERQLQKRPPGAAIRACDTTDAAARLLRL